MPQQELDRPGAGLPALELLLVRAGFGLLRRRLSDARATELFTQEGHRIMGMARSTPLSLAMSPVLIPRLAGIEDSSRNWSVYMVLDHLRTVNKGCALIMAGLCAGEGTLPEVRIEAVKPDPDTTPEIIGLYEASVEHYLQVLKGLPSLRTTATHPHPWVGPLDAHGWHCLAAVHHRIHRRQLDRILAQLEVTPL